jgi:hypothetical protein
MKALRCALPLAACALGLVASPAVAAQTLDGETLLGMPTIGGSTCTGEFLQTTAYDVSGQATGPYPGTFSEHGDFQKYTSGPAVGSSAGTVTARFTIRSGATTITGTKSGEGFAGLCPVVSLTAPSISYSASWTATRRGPVPLTRTRATYRNTGFSAISLDGSSPGSFSETFSSRQSAPTLVRCELLVDGVAVPVLLGLCR